jgi:hypothetical protein
MKPTRPYIQSPLSLSKAPVLQRLKVYEPQQVAALV